MQDKVGQQQQQQQQTVEEKGGPWWRLLLSLIDGGSDVCVCGKMKQQIQACECFECCGVVVLWFNTND